MKINNDFSLSSLLPSSLSLFPLFSLPLPLSFSENNQPPVAVITVDSVSVYYPSTELVLNGSLSTDDYRIVGYYWTQLGGPNDIKFDGLRKPVLRVSGLHVQGVSPTEYSFQLTVTDYRNLTNSTNISIYYDKGRISLFSLLSLLSLPPSLLPFL